MFHFHLFSGRVKQCSVFSEKRLCFFEEQNSDKIVPNNPDVAGEQMESVEEPAQKQVAAARDEAEKEEKQFLALLAKNNYLFRRAAHQFALELGQEFKAKPPADPKKLSDEEKEFLEFVKVNLSFDLTREFVVQNVPAEDAEKEIASGPGVSEEDVGLVLEAIGKAFSPNSATTSEIAQYMGAQWLHSNNDAAEQEFYPSRLNAFMSFCNFLHEMKLNPNKVTPLLVSEAVAWKKRLDTEFIPAEERLGYSRAPGDLTDAVLGNASAKHYFFTTEQVKIPAIHNAARHVVGFDSGGSGFLVSRDGHVMTTSSVLSKLINQEGNLNDELNLTLGNERFSLRGGEIILRRTAREDLRLAIIRLPSLVGKECLALAKEVPKSGETVFCIGFPYVDAAMDSKNPQRISFGTVDIVDQGSENNLQFSTDVEVESGSFGSPLLNGDGELIGVHTSAEIGDYTINEQAYLVGSVKSCLRKANILPESK